MKKKEIPKVIHYCWFGRKPIPEHYLEYISSWSKFCPDYKIIKWNEDNFDISQNEYCYSAYKNEKWAFVSDYARLKIIYEYGGIYLDTDVELVRTLDPLISNGIGFIGFQNNETVNTGLGFGAAPQNKCIEYMLRMYEITEFTEADGSINTTPCPVYNTVALKAIGLETGRQKASEIQRLPGLNVYPVQYFNPLDMDTLKLDLTDKAYSIHHFDSSWNSEFNSTRKIKKLIPYQILKFRNNAYSKRLIQSVEKRIKGYKFDE